jgi:hypothetical protein
MPVFNCLAMFDSLLEVCEDHEAGATARLYRSFTHLPWVGTLRGWQFEKHAPKKYLDRIESLEDNPPRGIDVLGRDMDKLSFRR